MSSIEEQEQTVTKQLLRNCYEAASSKPSIMRAQALQLLRKRYEAASSKPSIMRAQALGNNGAMRAHETAGEQEQTVTKQVKFASSVEEVVEIKDANSGKPVKKRQHDMHYHHRHGRDYHHRRGLSWSQNVEKCEWEAQANQMPPVLQIEFAHDLATAMVQHEKESFDSVAFEPGTLGFRAVKSAVVTQVVPGGQAERNDVRVSDKLFWIDGQPFSRALLGQRVGGKRTFVVTFKNIYYQNFKKCKREAPEDKLDLQIQVALDLARAADQVAWEEACWADHEADDEDHGEALQSWTLAQSETVDKDGDDKTA